MTIPMRPAMTVLASALAVLALTGCGDSGEAGKKTAFENSEVLEGSVSDDMIPYDTLRSEPPAAKIVVEDAEGGAGTPSRSGTGGSSPEAPPTEAAPDEPPPPPPPPVE